MFQVGFLYVSVSSLSQWWPRFTLGASRRRDGTSCVTRCKLLIKEHPDVSPVSCFLALLLFLCRRFRAAETPSRVIVSIHDQKLMLLENGAKLATYPVSTSKFGIGDSWGSMTTPLGFLQVAQKIGDHAPVGAVFHNRRFTGEILQPNAPGRDPVITRIIWLRGLEAMELLTRLAAASTFTARQKKRPSAVPRVTVHPDEVARCHCPLRSDPAGCRSANRSRCVARRYQRPNLVPLTN